MNFSRLVLFVLVLVTFVPAHGQQQFTNPSLVLQTVDVPANEFNKIQDDAAKIPFDKDHVGSWQITITNNLLYGNPKGNAVVRFYDATVPDKFFEIGMGSPPDHKFWVATNDPDRGYLPATRLDKDGWYEGTKIIAAYSDAQGVSIGNGKRIVVSNAILDDFAIGSYAVYGMDDPSDPPAINSGTFIIEVLSGDVSQNPLHYYPFFVTGAVGAIVGILLLIKKRS
jgi:hypothetical protein